MEFHRNSMPPVDGHTTVVAGATLGEAFKRVRQQFGPEAVISGSRSRTRRKENGAGLEKIVEVLVQISGSATLEDRRSPGIPADLTLEFRQEVERIERLVDEVCRPAPGIAAQSGPSISIPLAEHLVDNGASCAAVERILTRFAAETGSPVNDRPAALTWLRTNLVTNFDNVENLFGHHAFLSENEGESLNLILTLAAHLTESGRQVLVVSVLPDVDRDEPRLKRMAAASGYDAAVVRTESQLTGMEEHLDGYDLVLVGLPGLSEPGMAEGGAVHRWLSFRPDFHRHLLMSMDRDFLDLDFTRQAARAWICDDLALTGVDRTGRPAKVLDLLDRIPLPVSFLTFHSAGRETLVCATADHLLDGILATDRPVKITVPGPED